LPAVARARDASVAGMRFARLLIIGAMALGACAGHPAQTIGYPPSVGTTAPRWEYVCTSAQAAAPTEGWELLTRGPAEPSIEDQGTWSCFRRALHPIGTADAPAPSPARCVRYEDKNAGPQERCFFDAEECHRAAVHLRAREDQYRDVTECGAPKESK
jgi:hypothetical protein